MYTTSELYKEIISDGITGENWTHHFDTSIVIGDGAPDDGYKDDMIVSASAVYNMFPGNSPSVGSCVSAQLDLEMHVPGTEIPRCAKIRPYIRAVEDVDSGESSTASGSVVMLNGSAHTHVDNLVVDIEPAQDLHGYDNPWPAGGSANLADGYDRSQSTLNGTITVAVANDGTITINGTNPANQASFVLGAFHCPDQAAAYTWALFNPTANSNAEFSVRQSDRSLAGGWARVDAANKTSAFTVDSGKTAVYWQFQLNAGATFSDFIVKPMIVSGATTPAAFVPYANICPISGYTEAVVYDDPKYGQTVGWNQLSNQTEPVTVAANDGSKNVFMGNFNSVLGHKYLLSCVQDSSMTSNVRNMFSINFNGTSVYELPGSENQNLEAGRYCCILTCNTASGSSNAYRWCHTLSTETTYSDYMIIDLTELFGETVADQLYAMEQSERGSGVRYYLELFPQVHYVYNPGETTLVSKVNGDPYRIVSVDLGSTRYGGTLDVNSGTLTVTYGYVDLGTVSWISEDGGQFRTSGVFSEGTALYHGHLFCSNYKENTTAGWNTLPDGENSVTNSQAIPIYRIHDSQYASATATEFKSAMSGVQLCYELYEPFIVQLSGAQLRMISGANNIWSNAGDISITVQDRARVSEWIPQGVFYVDTREYTRNDDGLPLIRLHAYDGMMRAEADFPNYEGEWDNKQDAVVVNMIANALGIGVDERTFLLMNNHYPVNPPLGYSMSEVLSNIGAMYAANWIMNYDGDLLMVAINSIPPESSVLIQETGLKISFGNGHGIVSGESLVIDDCSSASFDSIVADIPFRQSGIENPTPQNVRPITSYSSAILYHEHVVGDRAAVITCTWSPAVYSGSIDFVSGDLVRTTGSKRLDGSTPAVVSSPSGGVNVFEVSLSEAIAENGMVYSDKLTPVTAKSAITGMYQVAVDGNKLYVSAPVNADVTEFQSWLASIGGADVVYTIVPVTTNLGAQTIPTFRGETEAEKVNVLRTEHGGDLSVEYDSTALYILV